jgi:hypothetical protein
MSAANAAEKQRPGADASLQHRLMQLEARLGLNDETRWWEPIGIVFVEPTERFGGRECCSDRAEELRGTREWDRRQDETQEQFKARVMADLPERRDHPNFTVVIFWPRVTVSMLQSNASFQ